MSYEELKQKAEISIAKAKELIIKSIPKEELVSIYVKGSYVQDELKSDSDVDFVVVLKTEEYLPFVYTLTNDPSNPKEMPFSILAYTMGELLTGVRASNRPQNVTASSVFVKQIDQMLLIYGTKPEGKLFTRTDLKDMTAFLPLFKNTFMSTTGELKITFSELLKLTLWLVYRELRLLGFVPEYSWQKFADLIEDKNHIVHETLKLRRQEAVTDEEKANFVKKLLVYLEFLEGKYMGVITK